MKKMYYSFVALVLTVLGAINVSAGERIALTADMVYSYDGFGADAQKVEQLSTATCILEQADGCPFGDTGCNAWVDLGDYAKLYIEMEGCDADGTPNGSNPRVFINRLETEGQFNSNKDNAKCLVVPNDGTWAEDFYTMEKDGDRIKLVVNLIKVKKEFGFVHLHSVKGSAWNTKVILYSIEAEKADPKQQVGWTNLINNSDMEGDDNSSFFTKVAKGDPLPSEIQDGIGNGNSRGIMIAATAKETDPWDNQFWFRFNEILPAGTKYRVSFDYRADTATGNISTQAHAEPSDYIHHEMLGDFAFGTDWATFSKEGEVTSQQAGPNSGGGLFQSIAFNLNDFADANNYYFDNIKFEIYKFGTTVTYYKDVIKFDFGFGTNIPELVAATGQPRLIYPDDCATVTVDGEEYDIESIEAFADGRFFIFLEDRIDGDESEVIVTFNNPTDPAFQLIYADGENKGKPVANYDDAADYDEDMDDVFPYTYANPVMISADPEPGSFNLPNSIKEFKVTFDKNVNCEKLVATINNQPLTVSPATGHATEITLTRTSEGDLSTGAYSIHLTKVFPEVITSEKDFTDTIYVVNVGVVEPDPDDVYESVMPDYFTATNGGGIPEGWYMVYDGEQRFTAQNYGSGANMKTYSDGGEFTRGFYTRTNNNTADQCIVEYGNMEGYELPLKGGKSYTIHYNGMNWKGDTWTKFEILNENDEVLFTQVDKNTGTVNGGQNVVVSGSNSVDIPFTPEADGNYRLKWTPAANANGDLGGGMVEILLANPSVVHEPNIPGLKYTKLLNASLENAKNVRAANGDERYAGEAYNTLDAAIQKYEAEMPGYTAPSKYEEAAKVLDNAAKALNDHRALCDEYDKQIKKAIDVVRQNRENKFAGHKLYAEVSEVVDKYNGSSEWRNVADTIADPTAENWQLFYSYDVLMEDAALQPAIDELTGIANTATLLFTEGVSAPENANGGKGTGVAVLVDRLRLGADALVNLIAPDKKDSAAVAAAEALPDVVAARNALIDSDPIAEKLQLLLKQQLFTRITTPGDPVFDVVTDTLTGDDNYQSYDMSVFVKAPNIYKQQDNLDFNAENVPGWTTPEGFNAPGLTVGWGSTGSNEAIPVDVMFQTWGGSYRVEQTVTDLPAGIYTVKVAFGERDNGNVNSHMENSFAYARTSETVLPDAGESDIDAELRDLYFAAWGEGKGIGQAFPFCSNDGQTVTMTNIPVADGILTIGVNAADGSHTFFNEVRLYINLPYEGFDYASELATVNEMIESGIESKTVAPAKVRALELYDLNGRRIVSASRGIAIVKKYMSDGTVRIEKVIKK